MAEQTVTGAQAVSRPTIDVAGVPFVATQLTAAAADVIAEFTGRGPGEGVAIRLMNAYCVCLATTDDDYMELVRSTGRNYPDGAPVAWVMKHSTTLPSGQVRGPSFFLETLRQGVASGTRHYFFGTTDETLELMRDRLQERFPGLQVAGMSAAPFAPIDQIVTDEVVAGIEAARPDIVWVGLGTPKQDWVAAQLADRLGLAVPAVGAAFDFAAGTQPEAPLFFQEHGLEWAYRFATEPRRLWKRYLWGNLHFIRAVAPQVVRASVGRR